MPITWETPNCSEGWLGGIARCDARTVPPSCLSSPRRGHKREIWRQFRHAGDPTKRGGQPVHPAPDAGSKLPEGVAPHWTCKPSSSKATAMRSCCSSCCVFWVLLVSGRFSVSKTIVPEAESTFLSFHNADTLIFSVDSGLGNTGVTWCGWGRGPARCAALFAFPALR